LRAAISAASRWPDPICTAAPARAFRECQPQVSGEILADIRDQANALVVVAGRIAIVVTSAHVLPQVCHRADLHERVLDEQQARVCRGVLAMSFASHLLIFRQSVRLGSDG
jgi:hypothetical protein